jgi:hypothetical protein
VDFVIQVFFASEFSWVIKGAISCFFVCYVVLIAISKKFNLNTIFFFDFHQGCVMVIHVILQGVQVPHCCYLLCLVMLLSILVVKIVALIGLWILLSTKLNANVEDLVKHGEFLNLYDVCFGRELQCTYNSLTAFVVHLEHLKQSNIFIYSMWFVNSLKEKYLVVLMLWVFASLQCGAMFKYPSMELFVMGKV